MPVKEVSFTVLYLLLFNILIYRIPRFQFRHFSRFVSLAIFNFKFLAGVFIWFVYTFYYKETENNDVHKFYNNALVLHEAATERPGVFFDLMMYNESNKFEKDEYRHYTTRMKNWNRNFDEAPFNENRTIIRINALLMFLSQRVYFVHVLFFSFFSFVGIVLLTNSVFGFTSAQKSLPALVALLLPSVLFWTSGVMKEPLLVLGMGLCISAILTSQVFPFRALKFLLGITLILFTKFFVLVCLLPSGIAYLLYKKQESVLFVLSKHIGVVVLSASLVLTLTFFVPSFQPVQMLINKQTHAIREAEYFQAGSRIEIPLISHNVGSIIKASANGIWNSLTRPYLWEGTNVLMLASAVETLFIVLFILLCVALGNLKNSKHLNLFLFLSGGSLMYFALVGMSTPVLGNLVRYKVLFLPLFMFAFVLLLRDTTIPGRLKFLLRKN